MQNHPVLNLIKKRYLEKSKPSQRKVDHDPIKLGLVIEGGGMRGVVGAGMATALHYLGLVDVFDAVYGSSAGALAGSLFVTGTMPIGPTIYYDDLISKGFIDLKHIFSNEKPIMNIDFLMDTVLKQRKPLNWKGVLESDIRLNIIVSSLTKRKSLCLNDYNSKEELFTLLRASATVEFVAGPPVEYREDLLWDSAFYEPIPYKSAQMDGCTHLLVLLTRPQGTTKADPSFIDKYIFAPKLRKMNPGLEIDYLQRPERYNNDIKFLYSQNQQTDTTPSIYSVCIGKENKPIGGLVKDRNKILEGAQMGIQAIMSIFLGDESIRYQEVLVPFNDFGVIPYFKK
jgi:predicted patatin/cPLA2 family phospholipase